MASSSVSRQARRVSVVTRATPKASASNMVEGVHKEEYTSGSKVLPSQVDSLSEETMCQSRMESLLPRHDGEELVKKQSKKTSKNSVAPQHDSESKSGIVAGQRISRFSRGTMMPSSPTHAASPRSVVGKQIKSKKPKPCLSQSDHGHYGKKNRSSSKDSAMVAAEEAGQEDVHCQDMLPRKSFSSHC